MRQEEVRVEPGPGHAGRRRSGLELGFYIKDIESC